MEILGPQVQEEAPEDMEKQLQDFKGAEGNIILVKRKKSESNKEVGDIQRMSVLEKWDRL